MKIKICIVDDHPIVVEGLKILLRNVEDFDIIQCAFNGEMLLSLLKEQLPDIIIMDINLPDTNGIDLCKQVKDIHNEVKIIGLSTYNETSFITGMFNAGALGYLLKNADKDEIIAAVRSVFSDKKYLSKESQELLVEAKLNDTALPALTPREKEIIRLLMDGYTTIKIANHLSISEFTAETHRRNILRKFSVNNTTSMIKIVSQLKLI